jgi:U32 family peptidase
MERMTKPSKVELLAPAGNFEKLKIAIHYGADAVYLAGKQFSLRNFASNFDTSELSDAIQYAHDHHVRVYVACNIFPRNDDIEPIKIFFGELNQCKPDAVIISDPGLIDEAHTIIPQIPIHLSTQANTTNYRAVQFWAQHDVEQINLARELSLKEIRSINDQSTIRTEVFVHGAMCMSYSGRCTLSHFLAHRDSNQGMCAQPCRWKYALVEEQRPGQYMPIIEDDRGAYIFNANDLCMIEHIPAVIESGVAALKIEGRMKGLNYLATTVKVYREAIDHYYQSPSNYTVHKEWKEELANISHRQYCTGFFYSTPDESTFNYQQTRTPGNLRYVGKIDKSEDDGSHHIIIKNKINLGDAVNIFKPKGTSQIDQIQGIINDQDQPIQVAQPNQNVRLTFNDRHSANDLVRVINKQQTL